MRFLTTINVYFIIFSARLVACLVFEIESCVYPKLVLIRESSCAQPQACATKTQAKGTNLNRGVYDIVTNDLRKFLVVKHFHY